MPKVYCTECKYLRMRPEIQCQANPITGMTEGDALYPPEKTVEFADPYVKNMLNDCQDYQKFAPIPVDPGPPDRKEINVNNSQPGSGQPKHAPPIPDGV